MWMWGEAKKLTIVRVRSSSPWWLPRLGGVRIDHPPTRLPGPLVLYSDEFAVKRQIVPDRILKQGERLIRCGYPLSIFVKYFLCVSKLLFKRFAKKCGHKNNWLTLILIKTKRVSYNLSCLSKLVNRIKYKSLVFRLTISPAFLMSSKRSKDKINPLNRRFYA